MPKKTPLRGADASAGVVNDSRFSSMHNAPIFKKIKKDNNKITVDERFQTVLTDDRFRAVPGTIDIYGRKSKKSTKAAAEKELNSFYQIEDNSILDDGAAELSKPTSTKTSSKNVEANRNSSKAEGLKHEDPETRLEYLNRLARGDVSGSSSDESDDLAEDSDADTDDSDGEGAATDDRSGSKQAGPLDIYSDEDEEGDGEEAHATCRLALMNCDWDNLKALDLLSVLQSFCPTGKTVKSVIVYPSDFGKEKMANEATHGPPKIWIGGNDDSDFEEADDDSDDGEDEDEGYDGIEAIDQEDIPVPVKKGDKWKRNTSRMTATTTEQAKSRVSKSDRKGDFKRLPGTVGIVLQDDLVIRGKSRDDDVGDDEDDSEGEEGAKYFDGDLSTTKIIGKSDVKGKRSQPRNLDRKKTMERERFTGAGKGNEDGEGGFDEVALRAYELSKLKYYFAVATLSDIESAEALMAQLDGVELGHSSMVFDLRYVPEDTSFEGRDVRDQSFEIGMDYQPPDFVVNALQHTTVQCSWDEGEKDRERKLTNISQWRQLQESELLQYVASSDSDDEEEEEDSDDDNDSIKKVPISKGSTKQSAANLRRLLLGVGSDDEFSEDSDDERHSAAPKRSTDKAPLGGEGFDDDFFMDDGDTEQENHKPNKAAATKKKSGKGTKDESDMTYTYVPDAKTLQGKGEERDVDETPFESMQRKLAEKRKSRKVAKKLVRSALSADDGEVDSVENRSKKATKTVKEQVAATKAELELLLSDDDEGYDMRALHKEEQDLLKGSKGKRKSRSKKAKEPEDAALLKDSTSASGGDFTLDLQDSRFARLLEGDSSFGIDRTSADFKETKAMKQIFGEQRSRREKGETLENRGERKVPDVVKEDLADNVGDLVTKLKRKYALQEPNKPKQARL